ncbi:hypothetical protein HK102_001032 [Quaeritorhiza haematococci]|nr:hypothetical protein HK102_001032 [Quaeritorhiza haematococci]
MTSYRYRNVHRTLKLYGFVFLVTLLFSLLRVFREPPPPSKKNGHNHRKSRTASHSLPVVSNDPDSSELGFAHYDVDLQLEDAFQARVRNIEKDENEDDKRIQKITEKEESWPPDYGSIPNTIITNSEEGLVKVGRFEENGDEKERGESNAVEEGLIREKDVGNGGVDFLGGEDVKNGGKEGEEGEEEKRQGSEEGEKNLQQGQESSEDGKRQSSSQEESSAEEGQRTQQATESDVDEEQRTQEETASSAQKQQHSPQEGREKTLHDEPESLQQTESSEMAINDDPLRPNPNNAGKVDLMQDNSSSPRSSLPPPILPPPEQSTGEPPSLDTAVADVHERDANALSNNPVKDEIQQPPSQLPLQIQPAAESEPPSSPKQNTDIPTAPSLQPDQDNNISSESQQTDSEPELQSERESQQQQQPQAPPTISPPALPPPLHVSPVVFEGFSFCSILNGATFNKYSLVVFGDDPKIESGISKKKMRKTIIRIIDTAAATLYKKIKLRIPTIDLDSLKRFACYMSADGDNNFIKHQWKKSASRHTTANQRDFKGNSFSTVDFRHRPQSDLKSTADLALGGDGGMNTSTTDLLTVGKRMSPWLIHINPASYFPMLSIQNHEESAASSERPHFNIAFFIMVHGNETEIRNVEILVDALLESENCILLIHVDKSSEELRESVQEFWDRRAKEDDAKWKKMKRKMEARARSRPGSKAFTRQLFRDRVHIQNVSFEVQWGMSSLVFVQLEGFFKLLDLARWDYVVNLSGHDYPLRSARYVNKYLQRRPDRLWIHHWEDDQTATQRILSANFPSRNGKARVRLKKLRHDTWDRLRWSAAFGAQFSTPPSSSSFFSTSTSLNNTIVTDSNNTSEYIIRPGPGPDSAPHFSSIEMTPRKHDQWMILPRSFVEYLRTSIDVMDFLAWVEHSWIPDEFFFGMVALAKPRNLTTTPITNTTDSDAPSGGMEVEPEPIAEGGEEEGEPPSPSFLTNTATPRIWSDRVMNSHKRYFENFEGSLHPPYLTASHIRKLARVMKKWGDAEVSRRSGGVGRDKSFWVRKVDMVGQPELVAWIDEKRVGADRRLDSRGGK